MRTLLLPLLALFVVSSAYAQDPSRLIGNWSLVSATSDGETEVIPDDTSVIWSFRDDGNASIELGIVAGVGTYSVQDGRLVIIIAGEAESFEFQAEPSRLVIDIEGTTLVFDRADSESHPSTPRRP